MLFLDNGAGIEPEYLEKIFEPFCQGSNASGSTGSGLGLAITQNLVHLMNGSITVSSTYGKGSCFTVELPLKRVEGAGFPAKNTQVVEIEIFAFYWWTTTLQSASMRRYCCARWD